MLAILLVTLWGGLITGATQPAEGMELKVLARATWPHGKVDVNAQNKKDLAVIRSAAELTARSPWSDLDALPQIVEKMAVAQVAKLLNVPDIDWNKKMLVLVTAGSKSSGGWKVNIDTVKVTGKSLKVEYSVMPPSGASTDAFTHPGQVVLVDRFDGPVTFVESVKKPKKDE